MAVPPAFPELQPRDERTALGQRLDQYRAITATALVDVPWKQASARLLPATDMTIAGIVKHLAWAEDRWFQGRLLGSEMPPPWNAPGADDPDRSIRLEPGDSREAIIRLYSSACERSREAVARCDSLSQVAAVPSFGIGPVNLRWILVHMIDETARHAGHLDLLADALYPRKSSPPRAAAGLRRELSAARPPGLGGGHRALGLADAVAHEPRGGSPVQGYEGQSPGEPSVLVASQRFRSRAFVGVEQSSRLEQFAALCDVVQAGRDVVQPLPDPHKIQVEGRP